MTARAALAAGSAPARETAERLLEVRGLAIRAGAAPGRVIASGIDFDLGRGETMGIVGESGSGKSLTAKAVARLLPAGVHASGTVRFDGIDILRADAAALRNLRGSRVSMLLQDPFTMMNPLMSCGAHLGEMLRGRPGFATRARRRDEIARRLAEVGLPPDVAARMPFQLSGGMCQRVAMATALARDPELLIADEPSTALDVTTQAEIMALLKSLQVRRRMSVILITHDLRLAFSACSRLHVLYAGALLEVGPSAAVEAEPLHPYTLGLLLSEPPVTRRVPKLIAIRGAVPRADAVLDQCRFAPRCDWAAAPCVAADPPLATFAPGRHTACIRLPEIASDIQALRHAILDESSPSALPEGGTPILLVKDLVKTFRASGGRTVQALKSVSLAIRAGESLGLVGESGSGKTTLGRCLVGLETPTSGAVTVGGLPLFGGRPPDAATWRDIRRTVQMVFQDPYSTLNPKHSVRRALDEVLRAAARDAGPGRIGDLLELVGLPRDYAERRPASLSGGERQRVAIARALAVGSRILVCDEPVSALDVSVQAQILNLFKRLQAEQGLSCLFITHDLAVVRQVVDRIVVLFRGEIVEEGPTEEVMTAPRHPYTRKLLSSIPQGSVGRAGTDSFPPAMGSC